MPCVKCPKMPLAMFGGGSSAIWFLQFLHQTQVVHFCPALLQAQSNGTNVDQV